jgi:hypothetical protein
VAAIAGVISAVALTILSLIGWYSRKWRLTRLRVVTEVALRENARLKEERARAKLAKMLEKSKLDLENAQQDLAEGLSEDDCSLADVVNDLDGPGSSR